VRIRIEPYRPRVRVNTAKAALTAVEQATRDEVAEVLKELEAATATWTNKPRFKVRVGKSQVSIDTDSPIFTYVDEGTAPHVILPRRARMLVFAPGSTPKTQPGVMVAGPGRPGSGRVFSRGVMHPGTEARNFTLTIAYTSSSRYYLRVQEKLKGAIGV
jgi:hypothetical protein